MTAEKSHRFALTGQDPEGGSSGVRAPSAGGRPGEPHCIHLLEAHSAELLAECHRARLYLALCGEELTTGELPAECEAAECQREVVYCLACIRTATRRNYEAGVHVDCPPGVMVLDR